MSTPTTGKIFKCIGVKENTNFFWRQGFTKLEEYEEASHDIDNDNHSDDDTLLLFDRGNLRVYVDRDQFEEVHIHQYFDNICDSRGVKYCIHCKKEEQTNTKN